MPEGALSVEVVAGSPAEKAGVKEGDILLKMDGQAIRDDKDSGLAEMISKRKVGDRSEVELYRDGEMIKLTVMFEASE